MKYSNLHQCCDFSHVTKTRRPAYVSVKAKKARKLNKQSETTHNIPLILTKLLFKIMLRPIDNYFMTQSQPAKGCLEFLRRLILNFDERITEEWKYGMPFYNLCGKMIFYLWTEKETGNPYLGVVNGQLIDAPGLIKGKRKRMKILLFDPKKDISIKKVSMILRMAINVHLLK